MAGGRRGGSAEAFALLRDLGKLAAGDLPLDELLDALAARVVTLLDADGAVAALETPPLVGASGLGKLETEQLLAFAATGAETVGRPPGPFRSACSALVRSGRERVGVLAAAARRPDAFDPDAEEVLLLLGRAIIGDLEAARLYRLATIDPETRAGSRQLLAERLSEEIQRARRAGEPTLGLCRLEVADLERIRAAQGEARAKAMLAEIVRRARGALRAVDCLARLEDAVFVAVLPGAGEAGAWAAAARMAARVEAMPVVPAGGPALEPRLLLGAAALLPEMDEVALLRAAERAARPAQAFRERDRIP